MCTFQHETSHFTTRILMRSLFQTAYSPGYAWDVRHDTVCMYNRIVDTMEVVMETIDAARVGIERRKNNADKSK